MVPLGISSCNYCGATMGKTFLRAKACFASFVRQFAQAWALDPLRFLVVQLRHRLMTDGSSDCLLTICVIPCRFPRDSTHGSLALKAYQQNLYLEYYY